MSVGVALINTCAPLFLFCHPGIQPHTFGATHTERRGHARGHMGTVQSDPPQPSLHLHTSGLTQMPPFSQTLLHVAVIFTIW